MQEKDGHGRSPVSQDQVCLECALCASTLAIGGLHFAGSWSLSHAFTFNCCSGLLALLGLGPRLSTLCLFISVLTSRARPSTRWLLVTLLPGAQDP